MKIADEAVAKKVLAAALEASGALDRVLGEVRGEPSSTEFAELRKAIGLAMGEIHCELVRPLWKQHPALAPED